MGVGGKELPGTSPTMPLVVQPVKLSHVLLSLRTLGSSMFYLCIHKFSDIIG